MHTETVDLCLQTFPLFDILSSCMSTCVDIKQYRSTNSRSKWVWLLKRTGQEVNWCHRDDNIETDEKMKSKTEGVIKTQAQIVVDWVITLLEIMVALSIILPWYHAHLAYPWSRKDFKCPQITLVIHAGNTTLLPFGNCEFDGKMFYAKVWASSCSDLSHT